MLTGGAYLAASLVLAVILAVASRGRHQAVEETDVFRYPQIVQWLVLFGVPVFLIVALVARATARPGIDDPTQMNIWLAIFFCAAVADGCVYLHLKRFFVAVSEDSISWGGLFATKSIAFSELRMIELRSMEKDRMHLYIYRSDGRRALKVTKEVQDFDSLVGLVTSYGERHGIPIHIT